VAAGAGAGNVWAAAGAACGRGAHRPLAAPARVTLMLGVPAGTRSTTAGAALLAAVDGALPHVEAAGGGRYALEQVPTTWTGVGAGEAVGPDLLLFTGSGAPLLPPEGLAQAANRDRLRPLDDVIRPQRSSVLAGTSPGALVMCRHGGRLVALPLTADPLLLVYDARRFEQARVAPPDGTWDWLQFRTSARRLTRASGNPPAVYGFLPDPAVPTFLSFLWQNGGRVVSADGPRGGARAALAEPAAVDALGFCAEFLRGGTVSPPARAPDSGPFEPEGARYGDAGWYAMTYAPYAAWCDTVSPPLPLESRLRQIAPDGPRPVAELPRGRQRATPLTVTAALALARRSPHADLAAGALVALAEQVTAVLVPPARWQPPAALQVLDPRLSPRAAQALANSLPYGHGLGDLAQAPRLYDALLRHLIAPLQRGAALPAEAARAANAAIQRLLDQPPPAP
jgi:hypothetical protein